MLIIKTVAHTPLISIGLGGYPDPKQTVFVFSATFPPTPGLDQAPVGPLNPFLSPGPALSTFGGFALPFGKSGGKTSSMHIGPRYQGQHLHLGHLADGSIQRDFIIRTLVRRRRNNIPLSVL